MPVLAGSSFVLATSGADDLAKRGWLNGQVKDAAGKPVEGVSVALKGTSYGATTAADGSFRLSAQSGSYQLVVSSIGYVTQEVAVTVTGGETTTAPTFALAVGNQDLSEVTVIGATAINRPATASKSDIAPLDLPQSVGIVTSKVIADQQVNRLGDVLKNVSGVSLTQQRQGVAETFSARGYSIGIAGSSGSIFKNGLISNTQGFPDASTLESIEVLKGASALLYGNVSGGVLINMITKKPRYEWGGSVEMRAGSYSFYKPIVDIYGPISKKLAFRVVGTYENSESFRDVVKAKRLFVNPSLMYKIGEKTDILLQGDYLRSNVTPDAGVGILNANQDVQFTPNTDRSRFINAVWAYNKTEQYSGSVVVNHRFSDAWRLSAIGGMQDTRVNGFGVGVPMGIIGDVLPNPNPSRLVKGDYARSLSAVKSGERNYNAQLNLNGKFNTGFLSHQLLVGGDALRIKTENSGAFTYRSANGSTSAAYDRINILDRSLYTERTDIPEFTAGTTTTAPSYRYGAYVQDLITIVPKLKVLGGVRYSYQNVIQTTIKNQASGEETKGPAADKSDKAFSPKGALIYQPLTNVSLYASYANNFITNAGLLDINSQPLKPSIVDQYEAGVKSELFRTKIFTNLSVYHYRNSNFAQTALTTADGQPNTNASIRELTGETTSDGMDVDVNGTFSQNFYFNVGYGYNYMRYTNTSGRPGSQVEGERLINNPAHTGNASVFYTFDRPGLRGLKVGASAFYTGQRYGGVNNTVNQMPAYNRVVVLTPFTTIDLSAGYTYQRFSILAKLSNITNKLNYIAHDRYSINPIPPRQFLTTVGYRF